jgi:hypothetical protein
MAKYYLDFKYNGHLGEWLAMCLLREDNTVMYVGFKESIEVKLDPAVVKNVVPVLNAAPIPIRWMSTEEIQKAIRRFFAGDENITIIADWPADITYFTNLLLEGSGVMIAPDYEMPRLSFVVERVDTYPTEVKGAVRHCAYWDVMALRHKLDFPNGMEEE